MMPKAKYDIIGKKNISFIISIAIMVIGIIFNIIFGTTLDIDFKGGSLITYSYTGEVSSDEVESMLNSSDTIESDVSVSTTQTDEPDVNNLTVTLAQEGDLTPEMQEAITTALTDSDLLKDNNITFVQSNSVDPVMGREFFGKSIVAAILASVIMIVYIGLRFRKIGGWSAGICAVVALLHDVLVAYFTFVIFRLPINDNFFAVILTILGYSINDTIVIYDRVRENRRIYGPKVPIRDVVNLSVNQSLARAINTALTTFLAIGSVAVMAIIFNINSIITFALPLMLGIVSGCYSSIFISNGLWVMWKERQAKKDENTNK